MPPKKRSADGEEDVKKKAKKEEKKDAPKKEKDVSIPRDLLITKAVNPEQLMNIITFNVNGLKALVTKPENKKQLLTMMKERKPHFLFLQGIHIRTAGL